MDLTLFIILVIFSFIMYYLVNSIQSLVNELREVKNKCIVSNNAKKEDFTYSTEDPKKIILEKASETFGNIQKLFQK